MRVTVTMWNLTRKKVKLWFKNMIVLCYNVKTITLQCDHFRLNETYRFFFSLSLSMAAAHHPSAKGGRDQEGVLQRGLPGQPPRSPGGAGGGGGGGGAGGGEQQPVSYRLTDTQPQTDKQVGESEGTSYCHIQRGEGPGQSSPVQSIGTRSNSNYLSSSPWSRHLICRSGGAPACHELEHLTPEDPQCTGAGLERAQGAGVVVIVARISIILLFEICNTLRSMRKPLNCHIYFGIQWIKKLMLFVSPVIKSIFKPHNTTLLLFIDI